MIMWDVLNGVLLIWYRYVYACFYGLSGMPLSIYVRCILWEMRVLIFSSNIILIDILI